MEDRSVLFSLCKSLFNILKTLGIFHCSSDLLVSIYSRLSVKGKIKPVPRKNFIKTFALTGISLCVLVFICVFSDVHTALAHGKHANASKETVTAAAATESRDALREFVLHAKAHWEVPVTNDQSLDLWHEILYEVQHKGDWKSGSNYLILVDKQGRCIAHGYYESAHGRDLTALRDAKGTDTVHKLIEAAGNNKDGGFVDYYWNGAPKSSYAVNYTVDALGIELVLIGGFHHEELIPSMGEVLGKYVPEVKAASVKDKSTLKNFVEKTAEFVDHVYKTTQGNMDIAELLRVSSGKEAWKYNEIYLFAITDQGLIVFNGNNPNMRQASTMNAIDENGVNIGERIIKVAKSGGGFIHYLWDNPLVKGDEVTEVGKASGTSLKVSYVKQVKLGNNIYILGSGIYPAEDADDKGVESTVLRAIIIGCLVVLVSLLLIRWVISSRRKEG